MKDSILKKWPLSSPTSLGRAASRRPNGRDQELWRRLLGDEGGGTRPPRAFPRLDVVLEAQDHHRAGRDHLTEGRRRGDPAHPGWTRPLHMRHMWDKSGVKSAHNSELTVTHVGKGSEAHLLGAGALSR
jgi:hypothetical protein